MRFDMLALWHGGMEAGRSDGECAGHRAGERRHCACRRSDLLRGDRTRRIGDWLRLRGRRIAR
jgi:hypothetical protein